MIEEAEHKTVAFDTYMVYSDQYLPRFLGVFHGSLHVLSMGIWAMFISLKKDKVLHRPKTILQLLKELMLLCANVGPFMLRSLMPSFNPRQERNPQWMKDWVSGYATLPKGAFIPLIDTSNPGMPVPFNSPHTQK